MASSSSSSPSAALSGAAALDAFIASAKASKETVAALSTNKQDKDRMSFSALYHGQTPAQGKGIRATISPFGLEALPVDAPLVEVHDADGKPAGALPLYRFATADRSAVEVLVGQKIDPLAAKNAPRVHVALERPYILMNGRSLQVTMFDTKPPAAAPMLVTVFNFKVTDKYYLNVSALDPFAFEAINRCPPNVLLRLAYPPPLQQMPAVLPLVPVANADSEMRYRLMPLPSTLVTLNRDYTRPGANAYDMPETLPTLVHPAIAAREKAAYPAHSARPFLFSLPDRFFVDKENEPDDCTFSYNVTLVQTDGGSGGSDTPAMRQFMLKDVKFWAENNVTLGCLYPRHVDALLEHHAVPVDVVLDIDLEKTGNDLANTGPERMRAGFADGVVTTRVKRTYYNMRDYLLARGIPVLPETLRERYGNASSSRPYVPADLADVVKEQVKGKAPKQYTRPPLVNPYDETVPHASGVIALDGFKVDYPSAADYALFALPLFKVDYAKVLTPEEGHAFVLAARRPEASINQQERNAEQPSADLNTLTWMQPLSDKRLVKKRTPLFLFFAVKRVAMPDAALAEVLDFFPTAPPAGLPEAAAAQLPADGNALRARVVAEYTGVKLDAAPTTTAVKRPRDDAPVSPSAAASPLMEDSDDDALFNDAGVAVPDDDDDDNDKEEEERPSKRARV